MKEGMAKSRQNDKLKCVGSVERSGYRVFKDCN